MGAGAGVTGERQGAGSASPCPLPALFPPPAAGNLRQERAHAAALTAAGERLRLPAPSLGAWSRARRAASGTSRLKRALSTLSRAPWRGSSQLPGHRVLNSKQSSRRHFVNPRLKTPLLLKTWISEPKVHQKVDQRILCGASTLTFPADSKGTARSSSEMAFLGDEEIQTGTSSQLSDLSAAPHKHQSQQQGPSGAWCHMPGSRSTAQEHG
ncbi:uncharacterized protein LOC120505922 [Passer montanus]|uniref:uncharacterized protein LOC120505922 n=1 Tax=Passer montanus TaxID=9160 RepID=UPI00195F9BD2|nr:uncharacterized protein LOC120505922 [Passer montanus]